MITLDQIQLLEHKVESAILRISKLNNEKVALEERCIKLESINNELRKHLTAFEQDQGRIEQGILNALEKLSSVENTILNSSLEQHIQTANIQSNQIPVQQPVLQDATQKVQVEQGNTNHTANVIEQTLQATIQQTVQQPSQQISQQTNKIVEQSLQPVQSDIKSVSSVDQPISVATEKSDTIITKPFTQINSEQSNDVLFADDTPTDTEIPSEQDLFSELTSSDPNTNNPKNSSEGEFIY